MKVIYFYYERSGECVLVEEQQEEQPEVTTSGSEQGSEEQTGEETGNEQTNNNVFNAITGAVVGAGEKVGLGETFSYLITLLLLALVISGIVRVSRR